MVVAVPCTTVPVDMLVLVVLVDTLVVVQDLVGWLLLLTREEECLR